VTDQHERRRTIVGSAARLFAEKGVAATTVREIADSVGVLSGSLYHHFPSKGAIADEVVHGYLRDLLAGYRAVVADDPHPREAVRRLVAASTAAVQRHPHATDVYRREMRRLQLRADTGELGAAAAEVQETWLGVLGRGRALGAFRSDIPVWVVYRVIRDALFHLAPAPAGPFGDPAGELAAAFSTLILDGITPPRPQGRARRG
jgi:AcrR family transcriptional regulator